MNNISRAMRAALWTLTLASASPTWAQDAPDPAAPPAPTTPAPAAKPAEVKTDAAKAKLEIIAAGELRIDGKISAILGEGVWQVEAVSWTSPRGVTTDFEELKTKAVSVGASSVLHPRGEATKVALKDVTLGSRVAIIGKNGPGGTLMAREVVLLEGFGQTKTIGLIRVNQLTSQLLTQGRSAHEGGQSTRAISFFNQAFAAAQGLNDRPGQALSLQNLGTTYLELGQNDKALDAFTRSVEVSRGTPQEASAFNGIGLVHLHTGEIAAAIEALESADRTGANADPRARVIFLGNLSGAYMADKRSDDALKTLQRIYPLEIATQQPDDATETMISVAALMILNQPDGARDMMTQVTPRLPNIADQKMRARLTMRAAVVGWKLGDHDAAKTQMEEAATLFDNVGDPKSAQAARDLPAKLEADPTADAVPGAAPVDPSAGDTPPAA